jgi:predicted small secreted protein
MSIVLIQQPTTRNSLTRTFRQCVIVLLLATLMSACATTKSPETDIRQRAQARWDALLAGDYDTAYQYYSPGYRSSTSRVDFEISTRLRAVRWTSVEVLESSCEADVCTVSTHAGYTVVGALPGVPEWKSKKKLTERWVRTRGQWWFLPED